jgi:hypothetical protein
MAELAGPRNQLVRRLVETPFRDERTTTLFEVIEVGYENKAGRRQNSSSCAIWHGGRTRQNLGCRSRCDHGKRGRVVSLLA